MIWSARCQSKYIQNETFKCKTQVVYSAELGKWENKNNLTSKTVWKIVEMLKTHHKLLNSRPNTHPNTNGSNSKVE